MWQYEWLTKIIRRLLKGYSRVTQGLLEKCKNLYFYTQ